jgi:hypothetical protein
MHVKNSPLLQDDFSLMQTSVYLLAAIVRSKPEHRAHEFAG